MDEFVEPSKETRKTRTTSKIFAPLQKDEPSYDDQSYEDDGQYYDEEGDVIRTIYKMSDKSGKMKEITEKSHPEVVESCQFMLRFVADNFAHFKAVFDTIYNFEFDK